MRRSLLLALPALLLGACHDQPPTAPGAQPGGPAPLASIVLGATGFYFLPPMVADPGPFAGAFDATRRPTARVVCTGAVGAPCPVVASFTASGTEPTIKLDVEGQSYNAVWKTPATLTPGGDDYRLEVYEGATLLGRADLWVVGSSSDLRRVPNGYVGVVRGGPFTIKFRIEVEVLPGAPGDPASTAIPARTYAPSPDDFSTSHPTLPGAPLSFNSLALAFHAGTTVQEANQVLAELDADIVGGIPGTSSVPGILFLRLPTTSHEAMEARIAALRANPKVRVAVQDAILSPDVASRDEGGTPPGADVNAPWTWGVTPGGGNWGLERSRVPQLWNLHQAVAKTGAARPVTGVVDGGFFSTTHPDLRLEANLTPTIQSAHGTHVAGIIGAAFNNGKGVDGVNPFARLVAYGANLDMGPTDPYEFFASAGFTIIQGIHVLATSDPDVRVINTSVGYRWNTAGIDTDVDVDAQTIANEAGETLLLTMQLLQEQNALPIVVAAAGNASNGVFGTQDAMYASPMNNAALRLGAENVIVVESVQDSPGSLGDAVRAASSNVNGHFSAPGVRILSTIPTAPFYGVMSGTSMAAPHVAGLVGYLLMLEPALRSYSLTNNPVRTLLGLTAVPVGGGASPRIDAFGSALAIDALNNDQRVLRMLVDVDDGTLHGNQRTIGPDFQDYLGDLETDAQPRDRTVSMRDFRRWRDWLLQTEGSPDLVLDGSGEHPKKDLNRDGDVGTKEEENVYPRGDFNGDGKISRNPLDRVAMPGHLHGQLLTDLEVLKSVFSDVSYDATELDGLIDSGDLEIDARTCLDVPGAVDAGSSIRVAGTANAIETRGHFPADTRRIYTAPVNPAGYRARVVAHDAAGEAIASVEGEFAFRLGSQTRWFPRCLMLEVDVDFPGVLVGGEAEAIVVVAVLRDPFTGETIPAGGAEIVMGFTAGSVEQARGFTNAEGTYVTYLTPPSTGSGTLTLTVNTFKWGQRVSVQEHAGYAPPPEP